VRRVLKSVENKAGWWGKGGKATGMGTIIKFLADTEMAVGGGGVRRSGKK
jgi:hypothetical protein